MTDTPFTLDLNETSDYQPLLEGRPKTRGMRSGRVFLQPGESCGEHSTNGHEEQLVFFHGRGTAYWGPEKNAYEVGVGKVIYIPPHTLHDIHNTGDEPLVYIYCVAPVAEDDYSRGG